MMKSEGLYHGEVVHARLHPVTHKLAYKVFSMLVDVDRLGELDKRLRMFGYNRAGVFSIRDQDHGDGSALRAHLDCLSVRAGFGKTIKRFLMLSYPRVLGFGFNPLTVYYGLDQHDQPLLMIYEVNNTFGEHQSYVLPVGEPRADGLISQKCDKKLYVSPFNAVEGKYLFHVTPPGGKVTLGVALKTDGKPLLRAHFHGEHQPLTDGALVKALAAYGWMSITIIAGIHFEALKLWLKGLRLVPRPRAPKSRVSLSISDNKRRA